MNYYDFYFDKVGSWRNVKELSGYEVIAKDLEHVKH